MTVVGTVVHGVTVSIAVANAITGVSPSCDPESVYDRPELCLSLSLSAVCCSWRLPSFPAHHVIITPPRSLQFLLPLFLCLLLCRKAVSLTDWLPFHQDCFKTSF